MACGILPGFSDHGLIFISIGGAVLVKRAVLPGMDACGDIPWRSPCDLVTWNDRSKRHTHTFRERLREAETSMEGGPSRWLVCLCRGQNDLHSGPPRPRGSSWRGQMSLERQTREQLLRHGKEHRLSIGPRGGIPAPSSHGDVPCASVSKSVMEIVTTSQKGFKETCKAPSRGPIVSYYY